MHKSFLFIASILLLSVAAWTSLTHAPSEDKAKASLYEIRNYNIDPAHFDAYQTWITNHGLPHIRKNMDVVGFWLEGSFASEVNGAPLDKLGSPNVTWDYPMGFQGTERQNHGPGIFHPRMAGYLRQVPGRP